MRSDVFTLSQFIEKARNLHGNKYDYSLIREYHGKRSKIQIICPIHGIFSQNAYGHYYIGNGCPQCAIDEKKSSASVFCSRSVLIHGGSYNYDEVRYKNANTKVCIVCPIHGKFYQTPANHLNGRGCKQCRNRVLSVLFRKSETKFNEDAHIVHGNLYDYPDGYNVDNQTKYIRIACKKHGEFFQTAGNHLAGHGCPSCGRHKSDGQREIKEFLQLLHVGDVETNTRKHLRSPSSNMPLELDLYVPEKKLAIEYTGLHWHSNRVIKNEKILEYRHLLKTNLCAQQGIRLLTIFENEWTQSQEIVKSRIAASCGKAEKFYARKTIFCELDKLECDEFLKMNHLQGAAYSEFRYGLKDEMGQLMAAMTFSAPRYNKKFDFEMIRFCVKKGYIIVGGASKLYAEFKRRHPLAKTITYADRRWGEGHIYKTLGFELSHSTHPNYFYFRNTCRPKLHSRLEFQKHKLFKKIKRFDDSLTEAENMYKNGWFRIFDCGNNVYISVA